jgi:molecular chaperone DnaK
MTRMTVDFGIDLGTTNSAVGVLRGGEVEIIKNNESMEYTPSVVFVDSNGALVVGRSAKERLETDSQNAYAEFKLQMGTNAEYIFARSGRRMKPEELSAEVLKSLKDDVQQRLGDEMNAAVITVPAAFDLPQCKATETAAQLAGITFSPLVQEPIAAATAYGFHRQQDKKVFWLVYDLGGGTFDAAVMQVSEGVIQVVNHGGHNHLGGKLIDWAIVEQLLIPALTRERKLTDFRRGNSKWGKAIAKLKMAAEQSKIRASREKTTKIFIESLCLDDNGDPVDFEYELLKSDVEKMAEPFILRSINICRKVLSERKLGVGHVEKVILVGGPTLTPYLRERLADPREGLGIRLDFSVDPLTIVARGAAIYAGMQRNENAVTVPAGAGQYALDLSYKPIGLDPEFDLGGRVITADGESLDGFTVEFINDGAQPTWRSGRIPVRADGSFMAKLWAEQGRQNTFSIELRAASGSAVAVTPDSLEYGFGMAPDDPPLIHSVGVALANNEVRVFFEKGTPLTALIPVRKRFVQKLAYRVARGQEGAAIRIPVVEGEHRKADRNRLIGYLEIPGSQIKRDLPAGTEVEVTIEINQSRLVRTKAFIALLGEQSEEFKTELNMEKSVPDPSEMEKEIEQEKRRLEDVRDKLHATGDTRAVPILERIEGEKMVEEVESSLDAARVDRDAADKCQNGLLNLKATVDELEEALTIPGLLVEAQEMIEWTEEAVMKLGKPLDQRKFEQMKSELLMAMNARRVNPEDITRKIDQMDSLRLAVLMARIEWWVGYFLRLEEARAQMTNQALAEQLFAQGRRAIESKGGDIEGVKSACRQLVQLLPPRQQQVVGRFKSTLM